MATDEVTLVWQVSPARLAANVGNYVERLMGFVFDLAMVYAAKIETFAKRNAPWTDRTGNARQGLTARVFRTATAVTLVLFHSMSYGIWLEVAHAGHWGIILKALQANQGDYFAAIRARLR